MSSSQLHQLRVLSYNIHHCNPPAIPGKIDVDAIAEVIKRQNPDLVGLQEVDVLTDRAGKLDQAQLLAEKTGMQVFFAKAIDFSGGEYGLAILSRFPILASQKYELPLIPAPPGTRTETRILASVQVRIAEGVELVFANTHLDAQRDESSRLLQMEKIREIYGEFAQPVIIAGDFNATPESEPIKLLDAFFERTCRDCQPTIPADNPVKTIDFIAYRGAGRMSLVSHEVIAERYASDHCPILSVFQVSATQ